MSMVTKVSPGEATGGVAVEVTHTDEIWQARIAIAGSEDRTLIGDSCDEVAEAAAFVVGVHLGKREPPATDSADEVRPDVTHQTDVAARSPSRVVAPALEVEARAGRRPGPFAWSLGMGLGIDAGSLPGLAPRASITVGTHRDRWAAEMAAAYTVSTGSHEVSGSPVQSGVQLASTGVAGCWGGTVSVCSGAEIGRVQATATSAVDQASGSALWVAAVAGPRVRLDLPWGVELSLRAEAVVPIAYPRIAINGVQVMNPEGVAGRSLAVVGMRFP
jgi:hypothetical protein